MSLFGPVFPVVYCPGFILRDVMVIPRMAEWKTKRASDRRTVFVPRDVAAEIR